MASVFINTNISKAEDAVYPQNYVSGVADGKFILTHRTEEDKAESIHVITERKEYDRLIRRARACAGVRLNPDGSRIKPKPN